MVGRVDRKAWLAGAVFMSRRRVQTARLGCILSCHKWHACAPCSSPTIAPPGCAPCMRCNTAGMGTPPPCGAPHPPLLRPRLLQVRHAQQGAAQSPKISQAVHSRQVQGSKRQRLGEPADGAGGTGSQLAKWVAQADGQAQGSLSTQGRGTAPLRQHGSLPRVAVVL